MAQGFLYGAATSAHQVEGGNVHNQWWEWERKKANRPKSGKACDHYNRWREDLALAKSLGHTAHRFSLEWSRIEPAEGKWNRRALSHYREVLEELRRLNIVPFVTLHHFTNPIWFERRGGWLNGDAPELFEKYARVVAEELGDLVDFWVTINEPMVYVSQGYWQGVWPPGARRAGFKMLRVLWRMARAHRRAYRVLHSLRSQARVGIAKHVVAYLPEHVGQLDDQIVAGVEDWWFNHYFLALTGRAHDFIGVNYYFTTKKRVSIFPPTIRDVPWDGKKSDMGWPIRPEGLERALLSMKRYGKPVYVMENGVADAEDSRRADFIRDHLRAVEKAQRQGVDVRGYFYWSLLDNFEWADGFGPRFGLVEVDYETMERRIRPSAYVYKAIIQRAKGMI